jgi:hypothetical protein
MYILTLGQTLTYKTTSSLDPEPAIDKGKYKAMNVTLSCQLTTNFAAVKPVITKRYKKENKNART